MTRSERLRRRIIWHLRHVWDRWYWNSFHAMADELGEPVHVVKREVRRMARLGRLVFCVMFDDDVVRGSGYFLTPEWRHHVPDRAEDPADDWSEEP